MHSGVFAKTGSEGSDHAISSDLVVLNPLRRADQGGIENRILAVFLDDFLTFFDEAFHGLAGFAGGFLAQAFENLLEPIDVALRLREVLLERPF